MLSFNSSLSGVEEWFLIRIHLLMQRSQEHFTQAPWQSCCLQEAVRGESILPGGATAKPHGFSLACSSPACPQSPRLAGRVARVVASTAFQSLHRGDTTVLPKQRLQTACPACLMWVEENQVPGLGRIPAAPYCSGTYPPEATGCKGE